jgi:prevent-host-death family protein
MKVNILEAKNRLSQLIKSVQAGEEVIIANRGEPVARLVPIEARWTEEAPVGSGRRIVEHLRKNPIPEHARRSDEEIEADIREQRNSWD